MKRQIEETMRRMQEPAKEPAIGEALLAGKEGMP
jgi:hypothetical protein